MDWVIIDLETTGLVPKNDKIIEIGAVKLSSDGSRFSFHTLINPECSIPTEVVELTGITDDDVFGKPTIDDILPEFIEFIDDSVPVAHNSAFDGAFLEQYINIPKGDWLDTLKLSKIVFPEMESYALPNLISSLNLKEFGRHRALDDAKTTAGLFLFLIKEIKQFDKGIISSLCLLFQKDYPVYYHFFESFEPLVLGSLFLPPLPEKQSNDDSLVEDREDIYGKIYIDKNKLLEIFKSQDGIADYVSGYRFREPQYIFSEAVADAINDDEFLIAEAGTGTGKTIGYLIPAVLHSLENEKPIVISTHTIHLQDQIIHKDIPELNEYFDGKISSVLLKGRDHYLCYKKWEDEFNKTDKNHVFFLSRLLRWVCGTYDGDADRITFNRYEKSIWNTFSAGKDNCLGIHCPYYHTRCFVRRARKAAENSNIIVVNHSLLLSDATTSGGVLPNYDYLVVDEAHQLMNVAETVLGSSISYFELSSVYHELLDLLKKFHQNYLLLYSRDNMFEKKVNNISFLEEFIDCLFDDNEFWKDGFRLLKDFFDNNKNEFSHSLRINSTVANSNHWVDIELCLENVLIRYREISEYIRKFITIFDNDLSSSMNEKEKLNWNSISSEFDRIISTFELFLANENPENISWLEDSNGKLSYPVIKTAPLFVNKVLSSVLFDNKKSIIFVSATLSISNSFEYYKENSGLNLIDKKLNEIQVTSSFDYDKQMAVLAVTDVPLVNSLNEYDYIERISEAIVELTSASKGRSLVLFTSHTHLREVFRRIEKPLSKHNINVLAHEISGNRSTLLNKIRRESNTVLLGANSFWEGIDIAGENLSLLIIVRLPFWPPDIPVIEAKEEYLTRENKNSFSLLSLPEAVIRFKQGFGRLLRKEDDKGVVCVLDRRIYEKRYGKTFIDSLPINKMYYGTINQISSMLKEKL